MGLGVKVTMDRWTMEGYSAALRPCEQTEVTCSWFLHQECDLRCLPTDCRGNKRPCFVLLTSFFSENIPTWQISSCYMALLNTELGRDVLGPLPKLARAHLSTRLAVSELGWDLRSWFPSLYTGRRGKMY